MAKGVHRMLVPVFSDQTPFAFRIMTQTDMIRHLLRCELDLFSSMTVASLHLANNVYSVQPETPLLTAIQYMSLHNVSAVPVVESTREPRLITSLSMSDFKGIPLLNSFN